MNRARRLALVWSAALLAHPLAGRALAKASDPSPQPNTPIEHFIVVMQENHTFDNYFGTYPGADGIPRGTCTPVNPLDPANPDCVTPFHIGDRAIRDLDHSEGTFALQYNEGQMNGFVYALTQRNEDGALAMGYYDDRDLPYYWNVASEYVLFDRFFSSAKGGSVWNHMYWVAGAPGSEANSTPPEGYGDIPTIFDRLQERGISWKFYVQNYDPALTFRTAVNAGNVRPQTVWVPLVNFPRFVDDPELFSHIVDLDEFYQDLQNDTLPAVAYIVPSGASEHPPGSIQAGQAFVRGLIQALMRSDAWWSSAFMWTYDDWGGWYDHVPPPQVDERGYGFRVPALLVSPYAKRGYIDSTVLDFTSILKFIEENWNLPPLAERDAQANSLANAFDFGQPPRAPRFVSAVRDDGAQRPEPRREIIYGFYLIAISLAGLIIAGAAFGADSPPRETRPRQRGRTP